MTDEKQASPKKGAKRMSAIARGALLLVWLVIISILAYDRFDGCFKLYSEIGATPWHRPDTEVIADHSECWSDGEIGSAMLAALQKYESDYYSYNGLYLMKLIYDDEFSCEKQDKIQDGREKFIFFRSEIKTGYSYDMKNSSYGKANDITDGYFTVEHMPDGSWKCHGWERE